MEILNVFLIIVGATTSVWLLYRAGRGVLIFMAGALDSAFRNRYPYDYLPHLQWVIDEFEANGYECREYVDAGSEMPGVVLGIDSSNPEIEIRLKAPLFSKTDYSIVVIDKADQTGIIMQDVDSEVNRQLLEKFMELLS